LKILLDENFPLQLYKRLKLSGYDVEHIIVLGQRGISDSAIRERITNEELLFLTQDSEFGLMQGTCRGTIILSRIKQSLPIQRRTEIWSSAIEKFLNERPAGSLFELSDSGAIVVWEKPRIE
jgi:hypothetical protein